MKTLAIAGAGGHGRVVADLAALLGWNVLFFDDGLAPQTPVLDWRVAGSIAEMFAQAGSFDGALVAIGHNVTRLRISRDLEASGARLQTLIHPSAVVSTHARIAAGSVLMPQAIVMTGSTVGLATIINTAASVDHDCHLGDGVHVSPGARLCGGVTARSKCWIGAGAIVVPGKTIGEAATVGAGSVVLDSVGAKTTVVGNPARSLGQK